MPTNPVAESPKNNSEHKSTPDAVDDIARKAELLKSTIESLPEAARTPEIIAQLTSKIMGTGSMVTKEEAKPNVAAEFLDSVRSSVVQIFNTREIFDADNPGKEGPLRKSSGSGVVISKADRLILTDDHVAGFSSSLHVNRGTGTKKYEARLLYTSEICDLALITIDGEDSDEFWDSTEELEILPDDIEIGTDVISVGYPMGGGTICMTDGKQSRIESHTYANSQVGLPISQITTPTNPGNSGGPGLTRDRQIAGITHQGMPGANNICHMIPISVINKFLSAYRAGVDQFHIFPTLHAKFVQIKNAAQRESLGIGEELSELGLYVSEVAELSCLNEVLREGDVLIGVDGYDLQTSTNLIPSSEDVERLKYSSNFLEYIHMKNIGDEISLKFIRDGEIHTNTAVLNRAIGDLRSLQSRNRPPSFYVNNGLVFMDFSEDLATAMGPMLLLAEPEVRTRLSSFREDIDQSPVIIVNMFDNTTEGGATFGYRTPKTKLTLVDYVNGEKVKNIAHLKEIMERDSSSKFHRIGTLESHAPDIVIPRLEAAELTAKLIKYGYSKPCSDDLLPEDERPKHEHICDAELDREVDLDEIDGMQSGAPVLYMKDTLARRSLVSDYASGITGVQAKKKMKFE